MKIRDTYPPSCGTDYRGLEPLMDAAELTSYLGLPVSTVYDWRVRGKGPAAYWFGKHLKFAVSDVRRGWRSTAKPPTGGDPMSWPRLTIGTVGDITIRKLASGRFEARTRYRDWDGKTRQVQSSGATAAAAERGLKARLVERSELQPADTTLTPDSLFADLVAYWLADIDMEGRISRTTRNL